MFGKKSACTGHTEETKNKIRISKLGKKRDPFSRSAATQETKNKISIAQRGKIPHNKGKITLKFECMNCNKMVDKANMKRWHGDNCKSKNQFNCSSSGLNT